MASASTGKTTAPGRRTAEVALAEADEFLATHRLGGSLRFQGGTFSVVSMYVTIRPVTGDAHRAAAAKVDSLLHDLRCREDGLDHDARIPLRGDVERIEAVRHLTADASGKLAIMSCGDAGRLERREASRGVRDREVVDETPDDVLADAVVEGGKVHHVGAETELGGLIMACSLRFQLPVDVASCEHREGARSDQQGRAS